MSTAVSEIETDPGTGLPVLPEGYFWRVGLLREGLRVPAVSLMTTVQRAKEVKTSVKRRWKTFTETHTVTEDEEVTVLMQSFDYLFSQNPAEIPEQATNVRERNGKGKGDYWSFELPLSPASVTYIAGRLAVRFEEQQREEREQEAERERNLQVQNELFGDYPPKTLSGAEKSRTERAKELFYADPLASKVLDWEEVGPRTRELYWRKANEESDRG